MAQSKKQARKSRKGRPGVLLQNVDSNLASPGIREENGQELEASGIYQTLHGSPKRPRPSPKFGHSPSPSRSKPSVAPAHAAAVNDKESASAKSAAMDSSIANGDSRTEATATEEKRYADALKDDGKSGHHGSTAPNGAAPNGTNGHTTEEKSYAEALKDDEQHDRKHDNDPERDMPNGLHRQAADEKSYADALKTDGASDNPATNAVQRTISSTQEDHSRKTAIEREEAQYRGERKPPPAVDWPTPDEMSHSVRIPQSPAASGLQKRRSGHMNSYQAGEIRFAPWNVPLKRRLQTLAVLLHSLSIASLVSVFFFFCAIPFAWPILIPYLLHVLFSNAASDGKLRYRSERFRSLPAWKLFAGYFPATLHKTHDLPATRKYIFGYHPHGIISHGAWAAFATDALGFSEKFPGITNSLLTLDSNFRIPIYRDYVLAMGLRSVSKESIGNILTRGGPNGEGMGRAVTIVVGGARESLEAHPGTLRLVLQERKGFIKLAVRTGADLVPVLAFGESDLYEQLSPETHPRLHRLQMFALRVWKFTLPFLHGRGIFNYDVGLMPFRHPLHIVVGAPIKVAQATGGNIDSAEVDRLHDLYVDELVRLWNTYKDTFAPDRKEELQILK